jgi:hypothetical protein
MILIIQPQTFHWFLFSYQQNFDIISSRLGFWSLLLAALLFPIDPNIALLRVYILSLMCISRNSLTSNTVSWIPCIEYICLRERSYVCIITSLGRKYRPFTCFFILLCAFFYLMLVLSNVTMNCGHFINTVTGQ